MKSKRIKSRFMKVSDVSDKRDGLGAFEVVCIDGRCFVPALILLAKIMSIFLTA